MSKADGLWWEGKEELVVLVLFEKLGLWEYAELVSTERAM
jgi:hypothetical protein